jgi:hypothetical protein
VSQVKALGPGGSRTGRSRHSFDTDWGSNRRESFEQVLRPSREQIHVPRYGNDYRERQRRSHSFAIQSKQRPQDEEFMDRLRKEVSTYSQLDEPLALSTIREI